MWVFRRDDLQALENSRLTRYQAEILGTWLASWEQAWGPPRRVTVSLGIEIVDHLFSRLATAVRPDGARHEMTMAHAVLAAAEKGASREQLHEGIEAYLLALPAEQAGLILLESICDMNLTEIPA